MRPARILLADDERDDRAKYGDVLHAAGYEIVEAESVGEAQDRLREGGLDLAVLDLHFDRNRRAGLELASLAKDIPVIILSHRKLFEGAMGSWKGGIFDYILKGVDPQPLLAAVRRALVRVFVVHGHDEGARISVVYFLEKSKLRPIVLSERTGQGRVIVEKFEDYADVSYYAVVLLTPDDLGRSVKAEDLQPRARQNVILEFGFFLGALGRKRMSLLLKSEGETLEIPSDCAGLEWIPMDPSGSWQLRLAREIEDAGIELDASWLVPGGR